MVDKITRFKIIIDRQTPEFMFMMDPFSEYFETQGLAVI